MIVHRGNLSEKEQGEMPTTAESTELGPTPRPVRLRRLWPLGILSLVTLFVLPHTALGAYLIYFSIHTVLTSTTGIKLPGLADAPGGLSQVLMAVLVAAAWNAMLALIWWALWYRHILHYTLARSGASTVGIVTGKRTLSTGTIAHQTGCEIEFEHSDVTSTMRIEEASFNSLTLGDSVCVLFNPRRPQSAAIYSDCEFQIQPVR